MLDCPSRSVDIEPQVCHFFPLVDRQPSHRTRPVEHKVHPAPVPFPFFRHIFLDKSGDIPYSTPSRLFVESTAFQAPLSALEKSLVHREVHRYQSADRISIGLRSTRSPLTEKDEVRRRRPTLFLPGLCSTIVPRIHVLPRRLHRILQQKKKLTKRPTAPEEKGGKREREREKFVCCFERRKISCFHHRTTAPHSTSRFDDHAAYYLTSSSPLTNQSSSEEKDGNGRET